MHILCVCVRERERERERVSGIVIFSYKFCDVISAKVFINFSA